MLHEWMNLMSTWTTEEAIDCVNYWMNVLLNQRLDEWVNERANEYASEGTDEWKSEQQAVYYIFINLRYIM